MADPTGDAPEPPAQNMNLLVGVAATSSSGEKKGGEVTARRAGEVADLGLCVSPRKTDVKKALQNMAKAVNLALQGNFLETELESVYKAARVRKGRVEILHEDYIGLGDGIMANVGRTVKSITLTLQGPDPASPEGKKWIAQNGQSMYRGVLSLLGRKLNMLQEFEDSVPFFVEQMLDRLEAVRVIVEWHREEWEIGTTNIGLDVFMTPVTEEGETAAPRKVRTYKGPKS